MCFALYSPSIFCSVAVSYPNEGEINLIITPDMKYHPTTRAGPSHPTSSANFLENMKISKIGFVMFK